MSFREKIENNIYEAARKRFQKLKRWQKIAIVWIIGLAVVGYLLIRYVVPPVQNWWTSRVPAFPEGVAGILVLRIQGDDEQNSLQRDLVSTLNTELNKEAPGQKIEVHAHNDSVTEVMGLSQAHAKARVIGKACQALLVIWGNRVGEKKFHPRLTVVEDQPRKAMAGERALEVQSLTELSLPAELVNQPIFLTHFAIGYSFYDRDDYAAALSHFEAALKRPAANPNELTDIRFYAGTCHWMLAQGQREMDSHLRHAIAFYDTVLQYYTEKDFPNQWAMTQNNFGLAFLDLPTGARGANLQIAAAAFEKALRVLTENQLSALWDIPLNNLGIVYLNLPTSDRNENLLRAIAVFEKVLHVRSEKNSPISWAMTQSNLGIAYRNLSVGDRNANLQKAITSFESALYILNEKDFPLQRATVQNNLGNAYANLTIGDRNANLQKGIATFKAALRFRTKKNTPILWAKTQSNLGLAYVYLTRTSDNTMNLQMAMAAFDSALMVLNEKDFPADWAMTQNNLGLAYSDLSTGDRGANLRKAIACFENALKIWTAEAFPDDHQMAANNLKKAQQKLQDLAQK